MSLDALVGFLTSQTGIVAAIAVVVSLVGGILGIVLTLLKRKEEKQADISALSMSVVKVDDPPPWSEAGSATFELMNAGGGKAVMSDLLLVVLDHGASETPKMVEAAAPVPQFTYKVTLSPGVAEYDVRKREFGAPTTHSYEKEEIESFLVELRTTEPHWYEFQFVVRWYDAKKPAEIHELRSNGARIEFKPGIEDVLE